MEDESNDPNGAGESADSLLARAIKDTATVTADGRSLAAVIDGVVVHQPPVHADHRGELVEMFTVEDFWEQPYAYAYQTTIRPGFLKGWFVHERKDDRYHIVSGELLVLLYDDRPDSPSRGTWMKLVLSDRTARQVYIPRGVWHLSLNIGLSDAVLVNLPTSLYNHADPDRFHIPFDSGEIPINVSSYFPVTGGGAQNAAGMFC